MKKRSILYFSLPLVFISCANKKEKSAPAPDKDTAATSVTGCYQYTDAKDTIFLKLDQAGESVTGTLNYNFFEKDRNTGTIQGSIEGDLLIADYTFQAEGLVSVRQVVFKKQEDGFVEGYGDINPEQEKHTFRDIHALQYNDREKLKPVSCQ